VCMSDQYPSCLLVVIIYHYTFLPSTAHSLRYGMVLTTNSAHSVTTGVPLLLHMNSTGEQYRYACVRGYQLYPQSLIASITLCLLLHNALSELQGFIYLCLCCFSLRLSNRQANTYSGSHQPRKLVLLS